MKPTLEDLRKLAEAAKAWRPAINCGLDHAEVPVTNCGRCQSCLGAKRAAEDVAHAVINAMARVVFVADELLEISYRKSKRRETLRWADKAARIESYFGAPGVVAAFAAAVREFCS